MPEYMETDIEITDIGRPEHPDGTCPAEGFQKVNVCVPVTVTPFAHTGSTKIKCCGDPVVIAGDKTCAGKKNGVCTFTISQTLCVEVTGEPSKLNAFIEVMKPIGIIEMCRTGAVALERNKTIKDKN